MKQTEQTLKLLLELKPDELSNYYELIVKLTSTLLISYLTTNKDPENVTKLLIHLKQNLITILTINYDATESQLTSLINTIEPKIKEITKW